MVRATDDVLGGEVICVKAVDLTLHERRFVQECLCRYPLFKKELAELRVKHQELAEAYPVSTFEDYTNRRNFLSDPTSRATFRLLRLEEQWAKTKFYVQAIEDVMAVLDVEKRRLVELKYFQGSSQWHIEAELGIGRSTIFRMDKEILLLFAHRMGI
jgi:DNA-directed RNA polymerase specialized sigma subunit